MENEWGVPTCFLLSVRDGKDSLRGRIQGYYRLGLQINM